MKYTPCLEVMLKELNLSIPSFRMIYCLRYTPLCNVYRSNTALYIPLLHVFRRNLVCCIIHYPMCKGCTHYTENCTLHTVQCVLYTVHCIICTVHCTLYTVYYTHHELISTGGTQKLCATPGTVGLAVEVKTLTTQFEIELLQYYLQARGIFYSTLPGEYMD